MLAKDLKIGEYGIITKGVYKDTIIKCDKHGLFDLQQGAFYNSLALNLEVQKLENVKITYDGCEETKSEFPKMMWVSDDFSNLEFLKVEVLGLFKNQYIVSEGSCGTFSSFKYAKDIEPVTTIELTMEEISKKLGLKDNEKLVIN